MFLFKGKKGNLDLFKAVKDGKIEQVEKLIAKGVNVNCKDEYNCTPLFEAVANGDIHMVKLLIGKGANVNMQNKFLKTPLHEALPVKSKEMLAVAKLIIEFGANVNTRDDEGKTLLHLAAEYGHPDLITLLVDAGASLNSRCSERIGTGLRNHYIKVNSATPLHLAVFRGNLDTAKRLIECGASVNTLDSDGRTPLYYAENGPGVNYFNGSMANLLRCHGATV